MSRNPGIASGLVIGIVGMMLAPRKVGDASIPGSGSDSLSTVAPIHETSNGLPPGSASDGDKEMLLKYTARCALAEGQSLEWVQPRSGAVRRFPGALGLAPEWLGGACGAACQEKVSSCLIALSNRTGRHVELSLLSAAPSLGEKFRPSADDLAFPHQEGAFFGNVFSGRAFACRGSGADKAPQVKRFCAVDPESCSGLAEFRDAGRCEDACQLECRTLSDGSQRCAAVSCRDPEGGIWQHPITTYLRNRIEAGNADRVTGARRQSEQLESLDRGDRARFELVDFGPQDRAVSELAVQIAARGQGGRIEAWLDGRRRLGTLEVAPTAGVEREQVAALATTGITGLHTLVLKVVAGRDIGRLSTIELRSMRAVAQGSTGSGSGVPERPR
jgi:hypothetical protein